jgi:hypothetical protein
MTLAIIAALVGCASEKVYHTQTSTQASIQASNARGLAVLVGSSARIEGRELIWSCAYQTAEGRVLVEQHEECERVK